MFCFGYPFVMAWYWMAGGAAVLRHPRAHAAAAGRIRSRSSTGRRSRSSCPATTRATTPRRRSSTAAAVDYPDFEVIAINDGSRDNTAEVLDRLVDRIPNLQGRSSRRQPGQGDRAQYRRAAGQARAAGLHRRRRAARSAGAALDRPRLPPRRRRRARRQSAHPQPHLAAGPPAGRRILLDHRPDPPRPDDLRAAVHRVGRDLRLPQARARGGRLVVAAHHHRRHRRHLAPAGAPAGASSTSRNAIVWILMPETLRGLWKQRLRWAEGGAQMMVDFFGR